MFQAIRITLRFDLGFAQHFHVNSTQEDVNAWPSRGEALSPHREMHVAFQADYVQDPIKDTDCSNSDIDGTVQSV